MKEIPSTRFRATFQRLDEPVVVTVNGHPIGTWTPGTIGPPLVELREDDRVAALTEEVRRLKRDLAAAHRAEAAGGIVIGEVNARAREGLHGLIPAAEYAPSFGQPAPAPKPVRRKR